MSHVFYWLPFKLDSSLRLDGCMLPYVSRDFMEGWTEHVISHWHELASIHHCRLLKLTRTSQLTSSHLLTMYPNISAHHDIVSGAEGLADGDLPRHDGFDEYYLPAGLSLRHLLGI